MGENAGRRRRRRRLGGHLQDRVAQPPVLRRAVPGRGHRRRRHRPRHPDDGRAAGRGDGLAALRPARRAGHRTACCPAWSPASADTATASGLPNIGGEVVLRRQLRRATRWSTRCASACCAPTASSSPRRDGPGQQGRAVRRPHRRRRHRRRVRARVGDLRRPRARRSGRACRSATRSPRRCSSSAAWRSSPPTWSSASRTSAPPGCPAPPPSWPPPAPAAWTSTSTSSRCAIRRSRRKRS